MKRLNNEEMEKLKSVQMEILLKVASVCKVLEIEFVLDSGTLLGAARHGGFIPWDDDIDIGMIRSDYEVFLAKAAPLLGDRYLLQAPSSHPEVSVSFTKVRKKGTLLVERGNDDMSFDRGIWIDIFPYDVVDASPRSLSLQKRRWKIRHKLFNARMSPYVDESRGFAFGVAKRTLHAVLSLAPAGLFREALDTIAIPPKGDARSLVCFHYFTVFLDLPVEDAFPLTTLCFEGHEMPVFSNWETYLELVYGDWRQLPPESKRKGHEIVAIDFGGEER